MNTERILNGVSVILLIIILIIGAITIILGIIQIALFFIHPLVTVLEVMILAIIFIMMGYAIHELKGEKQRWSVLI